jgi:hypothetical protein
MLYPSRILVWILKTPSHIQTYENAWLCVEFTQAWVEAPVIVPVIISASGSAMIGDTSVENRSHLETNLNYRPMTRLWTSLLSYTCGNIHAFDDHTSVNDGFPLRDLVYYHICKGSQRFWAGRKVQLSGLHSLGFTERFGLCTSSN